MELRCRPGGLETDPFLTQGSRAPSGDNVFRCVEEFYVIVLLCATPGTRNVVGKNSPQVEIRTLAKCVHRSFAVVRFWRSIHRAEKSAAARSISCCKKATNESAIRTRCATQTTAVDLPREFKMSVASRVAEAHQSCWKSGQGVSRDCRLVRCSGSSKCGPKEFATG